MTSGYDIILEIESLSQPWPKHYERVLLCTYVHVAPKKIAQRLMG